MADYGVERRAYQRAPYFGRVLVERGDGGDALEGRTFDVSIGGVGLACPTARQPATGETVHLTFVLAGRHTGHCRERVAGRVAWLRTENGCCLLGVEFLSPLHPAAHPALCRLIENL